MGPDIEHSPVQSCPDQKPDPYRHPPLNAAMPTLFISDLHLDQTRPHITALLSTLLAHEAEHLDALYILGDLFEAWIGDDSADAVGEQFVAALAPLREARRPCFFMHGNRDFLLGEDFARRAGMTLLPDPCVIDLHGTPTLLMHGDSLCTDDAPYQAFRSQSRSAAWQRGFLSRSIGERQAFAAEARAESQRYTRSVTDAITDVNADAVSSALRDHKVLRLIHGHTHRPAVHDLQLGGQPAQRIVLGDWYKQGSVLRVDADRCELESLPVRDDS